MALAEDHLSNTMDTPPPAFGASATHGPSTSALPPHSGAEGFHS